MHMTMLIQRTQKAALLISDVRAISKWTCTDFQSLTSKGRKKPTYELVRFVAAVREGLHTAGRL